MFTRKEIGAKLQDLRHKRFGDHIRAFERQSGVSRGSIPRTEDGESFPRLDTLAKWLLACKISFAHFFEEFEPFKDMPVPEGGYKSKNKRYHDELEFVLNAVGPQQSATVATLKLEYEKAQKSQKVPDNPKPHPGPNASDPS